MPWFRPLNSLEALSWKLRCKENLEILAKEYKVIRDLARRQVLFHHLASVTAELADISLINPFVGVSLGQRGIFSFPPSWDNVSEINILDISNNKIQYLPQGMEVLTKLDNLCLNGNPLRAVPDVLFKFLNLKVLSLSNNGIDSIPNTLDAFPCLRELYLSGNQLSGLPKSLETLQNLFLLDISHNHFESLPKKLVMYGTDKYSSLKIGCNPFKSLKEDVFSLFKSLNENHDFLLVICESQKKILQEDSHFSEIAPYIVHDVAFPCLCPK